MTHSLFSPSTTRHRATKILHQIIKQKTNHSKFLLEILFYEVNDCGKLFSKCILLNLGSNPSTSKNLCDEEDLQALRANGRNIVHPLLHIQTYENK